MRTHMLFALALTLLLAPSQGWAQENRERPLFDPIDLFKHPPVSEGIYRLSGGTRNSGTTRYFHQGQEKQQIDLRAGIESERVVQVISNARGVVDRVEVTYSNVINLKERVEFISRKTTAVWAVANRIPVRLLEVRGLEPTTLPEADVAKLKELVRRLSLQDAAVVLGDDLAFGKLLLEGAPKRVHSKSRWKVPLAVMAKLLAIEVGTFDAAKSKALARFLIVERDGESWMQIDIKASYSLNSFRGTPRAGELKSLIRLSVRRPLRKCGGRSFMQIKNQVVGSFQKDAVVAQIDATSLTTSELRPIRQAAPSRVNALRRD